MADDIEWIPSKSITPKMCGKLTVKATHKKSGKTVTKNIKVVADCISIRKRLADLRDPKRDPDHIQESRKWLKARLELLKNKDCDCDVPIGWEKNIKDEFFAFGDTLQINELGFKGTFKRKGQSNFWIGNWPNGCQNTEFEIIGPKKIKSKILNEGQKIKINFKRNDGNQNECPFSPGLTADYSANIKVEKGVAIFEEGIRIITHPGSNPGIKKAVKSESVRKAPFKGSISLVPIK